MRQTAANRVLKQDAAATDLLGHSTLSVLPGTRPPLARPGRLIGDEVEHMQCEDIISRRQFPRDRHAMREEVVAARRVDIDELGSVRPERITPVTVSDVQRSVDEISFRVSAPGRPVLIRESYYPNWKVHGAKGPYRIAPNLMVVVPTGERVRLEYGLTTADWVGRILTLLGLVGLFLLGFWRGGARYGAAATELLRDAGYRLAAFAGKLEHVGRERDGEIIDAIEVEVLEHVQGHALAGS